MKRIYIALLALGLAFTSCSKYLEEDDRSNLNDAEFYATTEGYTQLYNYSFSFMRRIYGEMYPRLFNAGTDLYLINYGTDVKTDGIANYTNLVADNGDCENFYALHYLAIEAANTVLYYADKTDGDNPNLGRQAAEARFLRALHHFQLVQQFGGVAIRTEKMPEFPVYSYPRDSEEGVYNFVIDEFTALLGDPNLPANTGGTKGNDGHVDKRVVNYYLALAHLNRAWFYLNTWNSFSASEAATAAAKAPADFTSAKNYAIAAIASQELTLTFPNSYLATGKGYRNNEIIFSIPYSLATMKNNTSGNMKAGLYSGSFGGSGEGYKNVDKGNTFAPTLYAHWLFTKDIADPTNDVRHENTFMYEVYKGYKAVYTGATATTKLDRLYVPWWYPLDPTSNYATWRAGGTAAQERASTIIKVFPNPGDPATNLTQFQKWSGSDANADGLGNPAWCAASSAVYNFPLCRKFDSPDATAFAEFCSVRDVDLVRITELYFVLIEASIKSNDMTTAVTYLNKIRTRSIAASDSKRTVTEAQFTSADQALEFMLDEKARECLGVYGRWNDLKRMGKLIDRASKYNPDTYFNVNSFKGPDGNNKILRPIPQSAIDRNKAAITQNPGY